jgi:excisionase family DNA binding protein
VAEARLSRPNRVGERETVDRRVRVSDQSTASQLTRVPPDACGGQRAPHVGSEPLRLLLTVREAAHALAVSERSLWTLTRKGLVPCVRLGRSVRYSLDDLRAFIEAQR